MSPDPRALAALRRTYQDAKRLQAIYPRHSVRWSGATNDLTRALQEARRLTGDETFCFPVK